MKKLLAKAMVIITAVFTINTANAQVVFDPVHWLETFLQALADNLAWAEDHILSEYRNMASSASNSGEITEVVSQLRNSEVDQDTIDLIRAIMGDFTLGMPDLAIDIGEIEINEDVLIEIMTEKLAEEFGYQRAISSRTNPAVIKDEFPDLGAMMNFQGDFYANSDFMVGRLRDNAINTQYDTGVATLNSNKALLEGLSDADALLMEVREDVLDDELGTNALLRRMMKVSLVNAEHTRAVAEAVISQTDMEAQRMSMEASMEAAVKAETIGSQDMSGAAGDAAADAVSDGGDYWDFSDAEQQ